MISSLHGAISLIESGTIVVVVSGVGFSVQVTQGLALSHRIGEEIELQTVLIPREDAMLLFGFETIEDRRLFDTLRGVSGIGPKSALAILDTLDAAQIAGAVANGDDAPFRKVPGVGPKTAKLIVVSLSGRMPQLALDQTTNGGAAGGVSGSELAENVTSALTGLGWQRDVAERVVRQIIASESTTGEPATVLRAALAQLAGGK